MKLFIYHFTTLLSLIYPMTRQDLQSDNYHGIAVKDPYRFLENSDSEETKEWISAQTALTTTYLQSLKERPYIRAKLENIWNFEKVTNFLHQGERYFFFKNDGLQNQSVLYTMSRLSSNPEILLDPNVLSLDGTASVNFSVPSFNGKLLAYGVSQSGSDWVEIKVRDVETKEDLPDTLQWVKFTTVTWLPHNEGFFYCRYAKPKDKAKYQGVNTHHQIYYHKLRTNQEQDLLIYERPDQKDWLFEHCLCSDLRFLIITAYNGHAKNLIFYRDLTKPKNVKELITKADARYTYVGSIEGQFCFLTDRKAPKGKLIAVDRAFPHRDNWRTLVEEQKDTLTNCFMVGKRVLAHYLKDAHSHVLIYNLDGTLEQELQLPSIGTAHGFLGSFNDQETFYSFSSFTVPPTVFHYDFNTKRSTLIHKPLLPASTENYVTEHLFYKSADGTSIPMFLVHKKDLVLNGQNPTYLTGYGGFNISYTPFFSPAVLTWLELGGVFAVANLRGGGEYGEHWHQMGMLERKQNVFDDFIAAAEFLIKEKITSKEKLAIGGGSNGGLLVAACLNQRPELFAAALPAVGVMDMLRFHKFTIGRSWISEYGSSDNPEHFPFLYRYSPIHNIISGTPYPPTLILTADHDDRVVPAHSYKYAAAMQQAQGSEAPILIRIESSAGHGLGKPTSKAIEEVADKWAFLTHHLKMKVPSK